MFSACVCFVFARCVCCVCVFAFARSESMRVPQFPCCVQQLCLALCLLVSLLKMESSVLCLRFCVFSPLRFSDLGNLVLDGLGQEMIDCVKNLIARSVVCAWVTKPRGDPP